MAIGLIAIAFLLTLAIAYLLELDTPGQFRIAFLKTAILYGVLIALLTEGLSFVQSLEFSAVAIFWGGVVLINFALLGYLLRSRRIRTQPIPQLTIPAGVPDRIALLGVSLILGLSLITALIAPPNNWDAMTYHMPRVMHWIQNHTVAHYPTSNLRQISFPPAASYIVAQFQILSGGDRFANCVQWLAFLGSILGVSLITHLLVSSQAQWIAALVCASIPMAVMQSTTTQTDLVLAFWLVCLTYFIIRNPAYPWRDLVWISASLGLAILTKPTAFIFGLPLGIILTIRFLVSQFRKSRRWIPTVIKTAGVGLLILSASLSLSVPNYWRNYQTFGTFLGTEGGTRNTVLGIPQLTSNILKYLAINFPVPGFRQIIEILHKQVLQVSIDDPNLNYAGATLAAEPLLKSLVPHEDFVGNPIHLLLGALALGTLLMQVWRRRSLTQRYSLILVLALATSGGFVLFCLLLKWQPWGNRLLVVLFILNSVVVAYYLCECLSQRMRSLILALLVIMGIAYALTPMRHPLVALPIVSAQQAREQSASILMLERQAIYFSGANKELQEPYQKATDLIASHQCTSIGLAIGGDDWEYPLWVLLNAKITQPFRIKHVNVADEARTIPSRFRDAELCAVIQTAGSSVPEFIKNKTAWKTPLISDSPEVQVYLR